MRLHAAQTPLSNVLTFKPLPTDLWCLFYSVKRECALLWTQKCLSIDGAISYIGSYLVRKSILRNFKKYSRLFQHALSMLYCYNMARKLRCWFRFGVPLLAVPNTTHDSISTCFTISVTVALSTGNHNTMYGWQRQGHPLHTLFCNITTYLDR